MSGCSTVSVSEIDCYIVEVCTPGPQGVEGPQGPSGPPLATLTVQLGSVENNLSPEGFTALTTRLIAHPAAGGTVISGVAGPQIDGYTLEIFNPSLVDSLFFLSLSGASLSPNQQLCPNNVTKAIGPGGSCVIEWIDDLNFFMFKATV